MKLLHLISMCTLLKIFIYSNISVYFRYSVNYHQKTHAHCVKTARTFFQLPFIFAQRENKAFTFFFHFVSSESRFPVLYYLGRAFTQPINRGIFFPPLQEFLASFASADSHSPHARCFAKSFTEVTRVFEYSHKRMERMYVGGSKRLICEEEISMSGIV